MIPVVACINTSFLMPNNNLVCGYITLFIQQFMDICRVSTFWLFWNTVKICVQFLCESVFSFLLGIYLGFFFLIGFLPTRAWTKGPEINTSAEIWSQTLNWPRYLGTPKVLGFMDLVCLTFGELSNCAPEWLSHIKFLQ